MNTYRLYMLALRAGKTAQEACAIVARAERVETSRVAAKAIRSMLWHRPLTTHRMVAISDCLIAARVGSWRMLPMWVRARRWA